MTYKTSEEKRAYQRAYYQRTIERQRAYHRERREIRKVQRRAWNAAHRDHQRAMNEAVHLQRKYGMSVEQYRAMVQAQGGVCAICHQLPSGKKHCGKLHVDHSHWTGEIRGLLCADCNRAIGLFHEDVWRLYAAAAYLGGPLAKGVA